jgi:hypothetical protein
MRMVTAGNATSSITEVIYMMTEKVDCLLVFNSVVMMLLLPLSS